MGAGAVAVAGASCRPGARDGVPREGGGYGAGGAGGGRGGGGGGGSPPATPVGEAPGAPLASRPWGSSRSSLDMTCFDYFLEWLDDCLFKCGECCSMCPP